MEDGRRWTAAARTASAINRPSRPTGAAYRPRVLGACALVLTMEWAGSPIPTDPRRQKGLCRLAAASSPPGRRELSTVRPRGSPTSASVHRRDAELTVSNRG
jgi:hypothetical protein